MDIASHASLCQRIRNHCSQKKWYGPDGYYRSDVVKTSEFISKDGRTHAIIHSRGRGPEIDHDFQTGFFPPATEEQLRLSEEVMGFSYPPLLRTLYLQVANGGFGPAYGLVGAFCGFRDTSRVKDYNIQKSIVQPYIPPEGRQFIDLEQYEKQQGDPKLIGIGPMIWPTVWSKFFIYLCEWGCGRSSYLHAQNGRVYYQDEGILFRQTDSLEEWLECWLQGRDLEEVHRLQENFEEIGRIQEENHRIEEEEFEKINRIRFDQI